MGDNDPAQQQEVGSFRQEYVYKKQNDQTRSAIGIIPLCYAAPEDVKMNCECLAEENGRIKELESQNTAVGGRFTTD